MKFFYSLEAATEQCPEMYSWEYCNGGVMVYLTELQHIYHKRCKKG